MTEAEEMQKHEELTRRYDELISSHIIQRVVRIDSALETIIAFHFCEDREKWLSFRSLLFQDGEVTFRQKVRICERLFQENYPAIYEQVAPLFSRLDKIRRLRNKFAHAEFIPPDFVNPQLYMKYYKNGQIVKELVDTDENKQTIKEAEGCDFLLRLIEGELERQRSNKQSIGLPANKLNFIKERCPTLIADKFK